ncbi:hypothetical protein [Horticoccus sp. 23ND18S-11]|uniref:hypothetical protein n=1 Tax=Horticoccus sp. 23ND18S-11 TaxID=3391832 RepID=UPI0039C93583
MQLPREPRPGDKLDGAWAAQVVRYLRAITPRSGPGVRVREYAGGTVFEAAEAVSRIAAQIGHPFLVTDATTETTAKVAVQFGQVNSITPTIGGTALDDATPPVLTVASGIVYLAVVVDGTGLITSASIHNDTTLPAADATHGYITLATVTVASSAVTAINQAVSGSLQHLMCGEDVHLFGSV